MGKKIKNKDLAIRLGVSNTLVSLVLNNKADQHGILKETQEKVLNLAKQMGYFDALHEDNQVSPVEEKPGVIGMLVPSVSTTFVTEISQYLQKAFASIGMGFSIVTKDPDDQRYDRLVSAFKKFYSGLILVGEAADEYTIRSLKSTDYPFVILEKSIKNLRLNTVCTDTRVGAHMIAEHIDKLGFENILLIDDSITLADDMSVMDDIVSAFSHKNGNRHTEIRKLNVTKEGDNIDFAQFEKYLRPPYRTDVVIIMNAKLVYSIMTWLRYRKIRVPQDIAIVSMEEGIGFDLMPSPITSLRKNYSAMSGKTVNIIWAEVRNSGKGKFKRQVNFAPELIIRNSC